MAEPMVMMMARKQYAPYRWVQGVTAVLGLWLIASPSTFGTSGPLAWSNIASGIIASGIIALALAAIASRPANG